MTIPSAPQFSASPDARRSGRYFDRELSWLAFNHRVLQEANDRRVPLLERLNFLAIYAANLDEHFRVRVAALRNLDRLSPDRLEEIEFDPRELLTRIQAVVADHQRELARIFHREILPELEEEGIVLAREPDLRGAHRARAEAYFEEHVRPHLVVHRLEARGKPVLEPGDPSATEQDGVQGGHAGARPYAAQEEGPPFLVSGRLYLVAELWPSRWGRPISDERPAYGLVEVPAEHTDRIVPLLEENGERVACFVDDLIRIGSSSLFPEVEVGGLYGGSLSRDAELYIEDEFSGDLAATIRRALRRRELGRPCRFTYDHEMPASMLEMLVDRYRLEPEDLSPVGRYPNLQDLRSFPRFGREDLRYEPLPVLTVPGLEPSSPLWEAIRQQDRLICPPYHDFGPVARMAREAADDPAVRSVAATLYRPAPDSQVVGALVRAAENGKDVSVFCEASARFSESLNLAYAEELERAGAEVRIRKPGRKVHAKLLAVEREEDGARRRYAYLSTGNFNEQTARQYADYGMFTADPELTEEVARLVDWLFGRIEEPAFEQLLVAPIGLREQLYAEIDREIEWARSGGSGRIVAKVNNLADRGVIDRLYAASQAGVEVDLIVRGICRLIPGIDGQSERIAVRSILDRYLEHGRLYRFGVGERARVYLGSADWMDRNLERRVEVAWPVRDPEVREQLEEILRLQLADTEKARRIGADFSNAYVRPGVAEETVYVEDDLGGGDGTGRVRAQTAIHTYLSQRGRSG